MRAGCKIPGCKRPKIEGRRFCHPHFREYQNQWNQIETNPRRREQVRNANLKRYGITAAQYDEMFAAQGGVCALCSSPERACNRDGSLKRLAVDHSHETGQVRELLCYECNTLLAKAEDNPEILKLAIRYLSKHKIMRAI
jgi:hypothetical protein